MASLRHVRLSALRIGNAIPKTRLTFHKTAQRGYSSSPSKGHSPLLWIGCISLGAAGNHYYEKNIKRSKELTKDQGSEGSEEKKEKQKTTATGLDHKKEIDYQSVYNDIANLLESDPDYDDGSFGPVLLRLAWHSSGTFKLEDKSGGSNGGTMRFKSEADHSANNGLEVARDLLEKKIKTKYPDISFGDLYTLGGVVAIQELGGPTIRWRPGRQDLGENKCTPDGRLPDGSKRVDHVRDVFYRMGFNDQEIVALTGAHVLGRCHLERSGFDGPWQEAPTMFSNAYFSVIAERDWVKKSLPDGGWQWSDKANPDVMMLPIEITMYEDEKLKPYYKKYAKDQDLFYKDFANSFKKLIELGVPFTGKEREYEFKRINN
ncbi:cytochrome c peroxidase Ccp1 [Sporodiniella umbellata]|nr:cytochrome c peroxidase Ccp1 [Sporodiniella umbellata]